jgi:hypothetical protein
MRVLVVDARAVREAVANAAPEAMVYEASASADARLGRSSAGPCVTSWRQGFFAAYGPTASPAPMQTRTGSTSA